MNQLLLPAPTATNGPATPAAANSKMDLLSGDDFSSPKNDNSLALVPVGDAQPATSPSKQNALALIDMFSDNSSPRNAVNVQPAHLAGLTNSSPPQIQQQHNFHPPEAGIYSNGSAPNMGSPQYEHSPYMQAASPAWNGLVPQQQPSLPVFGEFLFSSWLLLLDIAGALVLCQFIFLDTRIDGISLCQQVFIHSWDMKGK